MMRVSGLLLSFGLSVAGIAAPAATLSSLTSGGSIVESDLIFDNFYFENFTGRAILSSPLDADPARIDITTSSTASTVSLTATMSDVSISGTEAFYNFDIWFDVAVAASSVRSITSVMLTGDLFASAGSTPGASDDATSNVFYSAMPGSFDAEIFASPLASPASQASDGFSTIADSLELDGNISGRAIRSGDTAGITSYTVTFTLEELTPVPLPASALLLLAGMGGLGWVSRRKSH
ncbi:VPLPA-CTERM protein sorting domain-containing protein [Poseidonocella pacifica]|uniref:VPLPA-CTERM protein sorting domain-containing protein n=1 Tax=Poseidonocella pacifica TaxID=871651 RepID=A0A1I0VQK6_9RHOB|nr:VPLPA-CTERM sorting domain-containing protein [Poseidonocella pacifica]SFA78621.1 VPLPA-CTERM protein sorting domain-containing protein [Poseidonocella pacifica]